MTQFHIRVHRAWPTADQDPNRSDPSLVGQVDRTWLIPLLHRTLANPRARHEWPRYDKVTELTDACAYWEAAYYLLAILLGWNDVGLGLKRLYKGERPKVDSPHLDLLQQVWNDRDQLDLFALRAWERGIQPPSQGAGGARAPREFAGPEWLADVLSRNPGYGVAYNHDPNHDPYHGGSNSLHLGHCLGALQGDAAGQVLQDKARGRASLLLDEATGWYAALDRLELPPIKASSWRVDVVVRPLGWLGTFRKSQVTERWFVGKHSVHTLGAV